jgi:hypothetical protein
MARKVKLFASGLAVLLALGALNAASASAVLFHSEIEKTFGYGEQEGEATYITTAGKIKCKVVNGEGSLTATGGKGSDWTSSSATAAVTATGCTAFGQSVERTENGCVHRAEPNGTVFVECPAGKEIVWNVPSANCSITTGSQSSKAAFSNTTFAGKKAVKITSLASGLKYTVVGTKGSVCGEPGTHEANQVGIWVE